MKKPHSFDSMRASSGSSRAWQDLLAEAHESPWLLRLLSRHGAAFYLRFQTAYARLARLRPGHLRRLQRKLGLGLAGAALLLALSGGPVAGAPNNSITVDQTSGVIAVDGKCSLAEAINNANGDSQYSADIGECATGSGADTITLNTDVTLTAALPDITSAITIEGGGHTIARDSGAPAFNVIKVTAPGDLSMHSVTVSGGSAFLGGGLNNYSTVTLSNSTITGNTALIGGGVATGGGVAIDGRLFVRNSTISNNSAGDDGGGIANFNGVLYVSNSMITGNTATKYGGGIYSKHDNTVWFRNLIVVNTAISYNAASLGGGIYDNRYDAIASRSNTVFYISGSTVSHNTAVSGSGGKGGGIHINGSGTIKYGTISDNTANQGGGINVKSASQNILINDSSISGNVGGGLKVQFGTDEVTVRRSTISGNLTGGAGGGGIDNVAGYVVVQDSTLSGNSASASGSSTFGGGILNTYGSTSVQNSTLFGNSASAGGGIGNIGGIVAVTNSIVALQTGGGDCFQASGNSITSGGYNIESGTSCGFTGTGDLQNTDPKLNALSGGVHVPQNDSPVIDAGNPATPGSGGSACRNTDQRGQARDDLRCDIGAVEVKLTDTDTVTKAVGGTGTFTFGPTLAKIVVNSQGSALVAANANAPEAALTSLTVRRVDSNHPYAGNTNMRTGRYWTITPSAGASGYSVDLTLPTTFTPDANDKLCRYTGSGWDCAANGFDASTITRAGVTQLSDWTAGNDVKANPVRLQDFSASGGSGGLTALWAGVAALLAGLGLALRRRVGGRRSEARASSRACRGGQRSELRPEPVEGVGRALAQADAETFSPNSSYPFDKRLTSPLRMYHPPAVVQRGALKQFAGSPLAPEPDDPLDILGLGD